MSCMKSSRPTALMPEKSPILIIISISSFVISSSSWSAVIYKFSAVMRPLSSSSQTLKTFLNSSSCYLPSICSAMSAVNSSRSMVPEPSLSTRYIVSLTLSFVRKMPSAFMASFNSKTSIVPDPSLSKRWNALSISSFYSSVSFFIIFVVTRTILILFTEPSGCVTYL